MASLRHHLLRHRALAGGLIALALLMKVIVPSGYMLGSAHGAITVQLCSGTGPMAMAMPGMKHDAEHPADHKAEMPCAFAGLAAPSLAAVDPLQLAVAIAFVLLTAVRSAVTPAHAGAAPRLRPPLRGPPPHA